MSTLGPLTTVFTPSPSCASNTGYTEFFNQDGGSYLVRGPVVTEGCYPPGFKPQPDYYYTPGQCPSGYANVCGSMMDRITVAGVDAYCCPQLETGALRCATRGNSSHPLPTSFACMQVITNTTTVLPITQVSDGSIRSIVTSTVTAATIGAYGIHVQYSLDDKLEQPPDPERFNKVRLTYTTGSIAHDHGLSPEARMGVGIGSCFAAGLIVLGVIVFLKRKRDSHQSEAVMQRPLLSTHRTPSSAAQIRRKPVPSVHSSEHSGGLADGYRAVSTGEVQNGTHGGVAGSQGRRQKLSTGISLWAWEMLSLFVSVLSLASIIIVLDVYENRRLDEWTPKISINAVISVLSAVFKGSLALPVTEGISQLKWLMFAKQPRALSELDVYDRASRGAWGSALMIFGQFKSESKAYLASLGAALALVILVTDPFAQATISLSNCPQNGTDTASIPRASNYTLDLEHYNQMMADTFNLPMQLAAYRGILEPPANSSVSVSVSCTTGNCTFPEDGGATFTSLTMCSQTWDISDRIQVNHTSNGYVYSLGSKSTIQGGDSIRMSYVKMPDTSFKESDSNPWNRTSVLDVYILSMVKDNSTTCKAPLCTLVPQYNARFRPAAFVFSLFPCVQTFAANMDRGQYSEKVISEEYLHYIAPSKAGMFQLPVNRTMLNGTWGQCAGTDKPSDTNTVTVFSGPFLENSPSPSAVWYSPECVFEFYGGLYLALFLGDTFFTNSKLSGTTAWQSYLWRNGSTETGLVAKFASGLATSLGAQMRIGATGPSMLREARGTTIVEKTCIRIHWGYITFFGVVFLLEVLFLGIVMIMGYRSKLHADWKSSTLAVAFLSAGSSTRGGWPARNPESQDSLREAAQSVKASLTEDAGHWQLQTEGKKF
ncbi:hypothetical protein CCM_08796 [Cordyceps militaris CM01]|uniref:Uncharacterized protein n=1 Tax=Cordyceps militaris (strain CM01) TaxID=983644 RepID=G3JSF8_CORMM|nr:uncharacterized protein CCM_08796 [Cordyceps militaris CM01]EGX88750.1 hypothetical protein CCM_08796 [Cordyceps militaris CM01]